MNDTSLDTALRQLDPAAATPSPLLGERARTDLDRILATPASAPAPVARQRHTPRTRRTRLVIGGAAATALAGGVVVTPALLAAGSPAFAGWTATPTALTGADAADAADDCRDMGGPPGDPVLADLDAARLTVAERRGDWTLVLLAGEGGFSALCLERHSWNPFARAGIGSSGRVPGADPLSPRDLRATDLGTGGVDGDLLSLAVGTAGSEVVGVAYPTREHGRVEATVADGHFALWFPGDELDGTSSTGATVDVTYRDGSTERRTLALE